jgi:CspA family cold shock protein
VPTLDLSIARFDAPEGSPMGIAFLLWRHSMANGTVKWFNGQKGYGFIQPEDGGNDVFVHISAVESAGLSTLREGQKVAYETETGRNGKVAAINLRPL